MERVILIWPTNEPDANPLADTEASYDPAIVQAGVITEGGSGFVGLPGSYSRLPDDVAAIILAQHHQFLPVFLHDTLVAATEEWIEPIAAKDEEVGAVIRARDAIQRVMQSHLDSGVALRASSTVTSTENTAKGPAVIGRGVYYRRSE